MQVISYYYDSPVVQNLMEEYGNRLENLSNTVKLSLVGAITSYCNDVLVSENEDIAIYSISEVLGELDLGFETDNEEERFFDLIEKLESNLPDNRQTVDKLTQLSVGILDNIKVL